MQVVAGKDAGPEAVAVPVGFEDREAVGGDGERQVLGGDLEDPRRVVLGLHEANGPAEYVLEALRIDRRVSHGRQAREERGRVELATGDGEDSYALLAEPGRRDDLVAGQCRGGAEHRGRPQVLADPESQTKPDQPIGDGVVDDPASDDVCVEPGAVGKQAGDLGALQDASGLEALCKGGVQDHKARHELTDWSSRQHPRGHVTDGNVKSELVQLFDPPSDELGVCQRRRLGDEPGDLRRRGTDGVRLRERVESLVFEQIQCQAHEEQTRTGVLHGRERAADELGRVMAQRAAGECLVAEDRPVLDVHHRLQCHLRGKDRPVS